MGPQVILRTQAPPVGVCPPWLQEENGTIWETSVGTVEDNLAERARQGVKASFPSVCYGGMTDALAKVGAELTLPRGYVNQQLETDEQYRARLLTAYAIWARAGTAAGLQTALNLLGYDSVRIITNQPTGSTHGWSNLPEGGGNIPDGNTSLWARFWLVIGTPQWFPTPTWTQWQNWALGRGLDTAFSPQYAWGGAYNSGTGAFTPIPEAAATLLFSTVNLWRPAHAQFVGAFLAPVSNPTFDALPAAPTTWAEEAVSVSGAGITFNGGQLGEFWRFGGVIPPSF